jgi:signal transduction histidine kinase/CheY-like chemotaxis protein
VHPEDRPRAISAAVAFTRGDPFDLELRIVRPGDGEARIVRVRAFPMTQQGLVAGIATDVTEERHLEEELRHAQKMEAVGALASGTAHDFNNLLMGVVGFATIALGRLDATNPARAEIKRVVDIAMRGRVLTQQLLDFSRKRPRQAAPFEIDGAVLNCKPLLETLVGEAIHVVIRCNAGRARVRANAGEIEQILMNHATNARDSMPKGGTLLVTTSEVFQTESDSELAPGRYVAISVRDSGAGMDPETKKRIFEPFFTTKSAGTGLGLSSSMGIVRRMGGTIRVDSALGSGSTFTIFIPAVPETSEIALEEHVSDRGCVLVVEDDLVVRECVGQYLECIGYEPLIASDIEHALRLVGEQGEHIEVLLTDVMMPRRLGGDLAREVRKALPAIRVLYMSAHPREDLVEQERIERDAMLIQKPFDQRRLALSLHRLLLG